MPKHILLLSVFVLIFVTLCSCANTGANVYSEENWIAVEEIENINEKGTIVTEKDVYSTEDTKLKYTLYVTENYTRDTVDISANPLRELHRLIDGKWYTVPFRTDEEVAFIAFGGGYPCGYILNIEVDLSRYFHLPLPAGEYRIFTEDNIVSNTFTIE